jgi:hypothetical protein
MPSSGRQQRRKPVKVSAIPVVVKVSVTEPSDVVIRRSLVRSFVQSLKGNRILYENGRRLGCTVCSSLQHKMTAQNSARRGKRSPTPSYQKECDDDTPCSLKRLICFSSGDWHGHRQTDRQTQRNLLHGPFPYGLILTKLALLSPSVNIVCTLIMLMIRVVMWMNISPVLLVNTPLNTVNELRPQTSDVQGKPNK